MDDVISACAADWADGAARRRVAKQLGLDIDDFTARTIASWIAQANAGRKKYQLALVDVIRAIVEATTSNEGIGIRTGGKGGPDARTPTAIVLAVKPQDRDEVVFAIAKCRASVASPGGAWSELAPWQAHMTRNVAKARAWAAEPEGKLVVPIVPKAKQSVRQSRVARDAILAEILADPTDDTARLVYADWLAARGDPRGEFIHVQCALAAGTGNTAKLTKRETELRRKYGAVWMKDAKQLARECTMRRGFIASITMTARQFAKVGKLFDREPVEELIVVDPEPRSLGALAGEPHLGRLRRIVLDGWTWIGDLPKLRAFQKFLRSPQLDNTRALSLQAMFGAPVDPVVDTMFDDVSWPKLELLQLRIYAGTTGRRGISVMTDDVTKANLERSLARARLPAKLLVEWLPRHG